MPDSSKHPYVTIFFALFRRDMRVFFKSYLDTVIDQAFLSGFQLLLFAYMVPLFGMSSDLSAPIYLGTVVLILQVVGFSRLLVLVRDLSYGKRFEYKMVLPVPHYLILSEHVLSSMTEFAVLTLPLLIVGKVVFQEQFSLMALLTPQFGIFYLSALFYVATSFLALSFILSFDWMINNIWPRVLVPLQVFGCATYPWFKFAEVVPSFAYLMLLNPFTYLTEGFRSAILIGDRYISAWVCSGMLLLFALVNLVILSYGYKQSVDPVYIKDAS